jgi:hypothetical protein
MRRYHGSCFTTPSASELIQLQRGLSGERRRTTHDGENLDFDGTGDERGWEDVIGDEEVENEGAKRGAAERV